MLIYRYAKRDITKSIHSCESYTALKILRRQTDTKMWVWMGYINTYNIEMTNATENMNQRLYLVITNENKTYNNINNHNQEPETIPTYTICLC